MIPEVYVPEVYVIDEPLGTKVQSYRGTPHDTTVPDSCKALAVPLLDAYVAPRRFIPCADPWPVSPCQQSSAADDTLLPAW